MYVNAWHFCFFQGFRRNECKPLICCGRQIGLVPNWVEKELHDYADLFCLTEERIIINPDLTTYELRSEVLV